MDPKMQAEFEEFLRWKRLREEMNDEGEKRRKTVDDLVEDFEKEEQEGKEMEEKEEKEKEEKEKEEKREEKEEEKIEEEEESLNKKFVYTLQQDIWICETRFSLETRKKFAQYSKEKRGPKKEKKWFADFLNEFAAHFDLSDEEKRHLSKDNKLQRKCQRLEGTFKRERDAVMKSGAAPSKWALFETMQNAFGEKDGPCEPMIEIDSTGGIQQNKPPVEKERKNRRTSQISVFERSVSLQEKAVLALSGIKDEIRESNNVSRDMLSFFKENWNKN
eukprot:GCRY01002256.1.p1 GENE.GCRY01002256.1~~GCRY01002256.1.p1  ORF type:complete len:275 (+),score=88.02 GCRY01002256.1:1921-2745(+)